MSSARISAKRVLRAVGLLESIQRCRSAVARGHAPFSFLSNTSHLVKEYLYRSPNPLTTLYLMRRTTPEIRAAAERLKRDGIVILDRQLSGERLLHIQASFSRMITAIRSQAPSAEQPLPAPWNHTMYREQAYDPELEVTYTNDPFKHDYRFLDIALDEFILSVISLYIGKGFMLHQGSALRYYATSKREFASWQWHHDAWGRKVNVLVLLTDVTERDQYMSYLSGSHKLIHSKARYENSRFTEEEIRGYNRLKRIDCICSAGTILVFDSNGLHRGNRSFGAERDSFIFQYNAGRYIWPFTIPTSFLGSLNARQRSFLNLNPRVKYI